MRTWIIHPCITGIYNEMLAESGRACSEPDLALETIRNYLANHRMTSEADVEKIADRFHCYIEWKENEDEKRIQTFLSEIERLANKSDSSLSYKAGLEEYAYLAKRKDTISDLLYELERQQKWPKSQNPDLLGFDEALADCIEIAKKISLS